jgi:aryl-alcohol dehydrogenase-like predicted oxidoreductase
VGATKLEHLDAAVAALGMQLSHEEVAALEAPYVPHHIAGFV